MINKSAVLCIYLLIPLYLPFSAMAQKTDSERPKSAKTQVEHQNRALIDNADKEQKKRSEQLSAKQKRFEAMRKRYVEEDEFTEQPVYRKTKESKERPADRYADFEQKRERHRRYNEYIEQNDDD